MIYESSTCWLRVSEGRQHTGWQGRAEDDKTGAGMRQPWRDKVQEVRTWPVYKHSHGSGGFRGMDWDGMDGYGGRAWMSLPSRARTNVAPFVFRGLRGSRP